ncbi:MAG: molybdate ABC transporter substrate-binding protein [Eubacteriales bacterium]|jgi:molybdate transport system substrate-binding protein
MKKMRGLALLVAGLLLTGCGGQTAQNNTSTQPSVSRENTQAQTVELNISAAASLTDVAEDLTQLYAEKAPEVTLTFTFGSSGALQTQIEQGAPCDIFFSAAVKQMDALQEQDLIDVDSRVDLLQNKVVLIVPAGAENPAGSFEEVAGDGVSLVALGEPSSVPVGQYSEEVFTSLGILDDVKAKANYGSDVRQVLTWVESGEVDCGVVYATDAATSDQVQVVCEAPEGSCQPVIYPVAVTSGSGQPQAAADFVEFLQSDEAMEIFAQYGFASNLGE